MDNSTQITEEVKNKTYSDITEIVLRSLENGSLSAEDAHDASEYILGRLDSLPNQSYLEAFLEEIAERWPCFKPLLFAQEEKTEENKTQQDIQNIQEEIKQIMAGEVFSSLFNHTLCLHFLASRIGKKS